MLRDGVDELLREVNQRHGTAFRIRREFRAAVNSGAFLVEGAGSGERIPKWVATPESLEAQRKRSV